MILGLLAATGLADAQRNPAGRLKQQSGKAGCINVTGTACLRGRAISQPADLAVSPDGRHAYVTAFGSDAVAVFARNRRTGALRQLPGRRGCIGDKGAGPCAFGRGLGKPLSVAVSPDGRNVYVSATGSDALAVFARNRRTGALSQLRGPRGCLSPFSSGGCGGARALDEPITVVVSGNGRRVYVASRAPGAVAVFHRRSSGELVQPAGQSGCIGQRGREGCAPGRALNASWDVALSPDGKTVYAAALDSNSVAILPVTPTGLSQRDGEAGCLARDTSEGCARARALGLPSGLVVSPDGRNVYVASTDRDAIAILRRDRSTGALSQPSGRNACISQSGGAGCTIGDALHGPEDIAVSADGRSVYVVSAAINSIAALARKAGAGTLSQLPGRWGCLIRGGVAGCREGRGLTIAVNVTVSPDGRNVYTGSEARRFGAIGIFRRLAR